MVVSLAIVGIANQLEKSKQELQQALLAERAGTARLRAVTDGVDEALVLVSTDQRILDINQRFVDLFGVPAERPDGPTPGGHPHPVRSSVCRRR